MHEDAIRYYGLDGFSVGCETTGLGVLELETFPRDKVLGLVSEAARRLVQEKGADCIALGCAGMTEMKIRCEETVGAKDATAQVIVGVGVGVQLLIGLVGFQVLGCRWLLLLPADCRWNLPASSLSANRLPSMDEPPRLPMSPAETGEGAGRPAL